MKTILKYIVIIVCTASQSLYAQTNNMEWASSFGSAQIDQGTGVATDDLGNSYFTGFFQGQVDFNPGPGIFQLTSSGSNDVYIIKLDENGNFIWAKSIGGIGDDRPTTITLGNANSVLIGGSYTGTPDFDPGAGVVNHACAGFTDGFLVKLDSAGNYQSVIVSGGSGEDVITGVTYNTVGAYVVTGYFETTMNFFPGNTGSLVSAGSYDMFVASFDLQLNFDWSKRMGGLTRNYGMEIKSDTAGNIYTGGYFNGTGDYDPGTGVFNVTSNGSYDILVMKMNAAGDFIWAKNCGSGTDDAANGIDVTANGTIFVTGYFSGAADFDPGAGVNTLTSTGSQDCFIMKMDSSGSPLWVKQAGGSSTSQTTGLQIKALSDGGVILSGTFMGTVDMNPGTAVSNVTSSGIEDGFVLRLSTQGNLVEHAIFGAAGFDVVNSVAEGINGAIVLTGSFTGTIDADPFGGLNQLVSVGATDAFVLKLGSSFTAVPEITTPVTIQVYPNPASEYIQINMHEVKEGQRLTIYNQAGSLLFEQQNISGEQLSVDINQWNEGLYYVILEGGGPQGVSKFVKLNSK